MKWRQNSCAEHAEDAKWALCTHTVCAHTPHTHIWRTSKLSEQTHKHWIHPNYLREPGSFFCAKSSIGQQLLQQNQHHRPFMYQPTCTTLGLTRAHNQTNKVSGVDSTGLWGAYPGVLSDTPTDCVTQCANVPHQTPCKLCTKWNQMWCHVHLRATLFYNKTVQGMSSLKTSSIIRVANVTSDWENAELVAGCLGLW